MLTSKQRSKLISLAANLEPVGQVGKEGIGENMIKGFSECLEARELIKITILNNCDIPLDELCRDLAVKLRAELVKVIGRKCILYRKSHKKIEHISF